MWKDVRKKPVTVQAVEVTPGTMAEIVTGEHDMVLGDFKDAPCIWVNTRNGMSPAVPGVHYIIRGAQGEVYPVVGDIYRETYEDAA